jgi:O-antigen/teichoic acid export membrane protein
MLSAVVTTACAIVSAKIWATSVGPTGVGEMALLQGLVGIAAIAFGVGASSGLIQFGSLVQDSDKPGDVLSLYKAAWIVVATGGLMAAGLLLLFRKEVSTYLVGNGSRQGDVMIVSVALGLTLVNGIQMGMLNALHRVREMALCAVISALGANLLASLVVLTWGVPGIPYAFLASTSITTVVSWLFVKHLHLHATVADCWKQTFGWVKSLLKFGIPYTASNLFGTGVQVVMPMVVFRCLGADSVGFYRAGTAIGFTYIGFLLVSLAQDFYPRVVKCRSDSSKLRVLMNGELHIVLLVGTPMVLITLSLAPVAVPILYSVKFLPAVDMLRWQLMADIFRLSSWTMSFIILARCGSLTFLGIEVVGGVSILLASWLGMRCFGMTGIGVGFLVGYVTYFLLVAFIIRSRLGLSWTRGNKLLLAAAVASTIVFRVIPLLARQGVYIPVGIVASTVAASYGIAALTMDRRNSRRLPEVAQE